MKRKGKVALLDDILVYLFFIVIAVGFLLWASILGANYDDTNNAITSEFDSVEADTILLGLMRFTVNEDLDQNGIVEARTIADLISLQADKGIVEEHVRKALFHVCTDGVEYRCGWKLKIGEEMSFESENTPGFIDKLMGKGDFVESVIYVPVKDGEEEVMKVVYRHYEP